jgi:hypothetical protein
MIERLGHALYAVSWPVALWCILSGIVGSLSMLFLAGFLVPILGYAARYVLTGRKRPW